MISGETMRAAFRYITGETEHICRLCFASTTEKEVFITENAKLQQPYYVDTIAYNDMLDDLGVTMEPSLPEVLCVDCAAALQKTFLFKKLCQHADNKWNKFIGKFSKSLDLADTAGPNVILAYLIVSDTENIMVTSRKNQEQKTKKAALAKLKHMIKIRENYVKVKKKPKSFVRCEICKGKFDSNCRLDKHYKKAHNKTTYPCRHCSKVFSSRLLLKGHSERIHLSKRIQCSKCSKMFSTERLLRYHDNYHHMAAICKLCFVQFPSRKDLKAHVDKHDVNNCPKCGKSFFNKNTFKSHLTLCGVTEKNPKFFCDICKKGYFQKNGLKTHLTISHGFGRTVSCSWCGKKYNGVSKLKIHIVKHTKEKNYHCELCGGKFGTQMALVYHSRLHTGERPFPCDLCDESFLSASRRMEHKRRKHFGPTKKCPLCKMKFITKYQLEKHLNKHYNPHSKLYVVNAASADPKLIKDDEIVMKEKTVPVTKRITFYCPTSYHQ